MVAVSSTIFTTGIERAPCTRSSRRTELCWCNNPVQTPRHIYISMGGGYSWSSMDIREGGPRHEKIGTIYRSRCPVFLFQKGRRKPSHLRIYLEVGLRMVFSCFSQLVKRLLQVRYLSSFPDFPESIRTDGVQRQAYPVKARPDDGRGANLINQQAVGLKDNA